MPAENTYQYIPGACNIGEAGIRRRYRIGYIGLFFATAIILLIHLTKAPSWWRLLIFIPVFYSVSGFIQARYKFCYVFGFAHAFNMGGRRSLSKVTDAENVRKDRKKAIRIVALVSLISLVITLVYYFL